MALSPEHDRLRQLVLSWEELSEDERRDAESHLVACPECRALRAAFERHERVPGPLGAFSESAFDPPVALPSGQREPADASRDALLSRLGARVHEAASLPTAPQRLRARRRAWTQWWWAPAAAAAAIAVVWLMRPIPTRNDLLRELEAIPLHVVRGHADSGGAAGTGWRRGDEFELRVRLARPAWLVVVHVAADGGVSLLRPEVREPAPSGAGVQRLGPSDPSLAWVIEGPAGTEVLFVAAVADGPVDRSRLLRELGVLAASEDREVRLEQVRRLLDRRFGAPLRVDIAHD